MWPRKRLEYSMVEDGGVGVSAAAFPTTKKSLSDSSGDLLNRSQRITHTGVVFGLTAAAAVLCNFLGGYNAVWPLLSSVNGMLAEVGSFASAAKSLLEAAIVAACSVLWWPLLCGCAVTAFVWSLVYIDSERPGSSPPSPLRGTVVRMQRFSYETTSSLIRHQRSFHLNYLMSLASGATVCLLMIVSATTTLLE